MDRYAAVIAALLLSCSCTPPLHGQPDAQASVERLMGLGADAMRQGKAPEAERYFAEASIKSPSLPNAWLGLGMAQLREGRSSDASSSLSRALTLNPHTPGAHLFLGIALYQQKKLQPAIEALAEEVRLQPKNIEALTWLGIVQMGAGHPELATSPFDQAATLSPKDLNLLYYQAHAHTLVAQSAYQAMYRLGPDSWQVHHALGEDFAASGQAEKAIAEYQAAIAKQPANADLYESLGEEYQKVSRFDDATNAYRKELELSPRNGIALYNLGKIQVERGDAASGVPLLRGAAEANTSPAPTAFYLGLGLAKLGQNQEAAQWLERSLQNNPSDFICQGALYELGRIYQKLGRKEDSQHAVEQLKKLKDQMAASGEK